GDRQQSVLEAVVPEDVCKRRADHRAKAEPQQRPGRMLARAAAAKIVSRYQNAGPVRARLVQNKLRLRIPARVIAPVAKQALAQTTLVGDLQEPRRNDLVRVDIINRQRDETGREGSNGIHDSNVLTSVTTPVNALAAAVSGLARKVRPPLPCRPSKLRFDVETQYCPA